MTGNEEKFRGVRLTEGVLLMLAPVVGLVLTFAFEAGYLGWFGVPLWFVRPDATHVVVAAAALAAGLSVIMAYLRFVPIMPWAPLLYLLLFPVSLALLSVALLLAVKWTLSWKLVLQLLIGVPAGVGAIWTFYAFLIRPIRRHKELGDWEARWRHQVTTIGPPQNVNMEQQAWAKLSDVLGPRVTAGFLLLLVGTFAMNWWGRKQAGKETTHVITAVGNQPCIALRRYGEGMLCVGVDTTTWQVQEKFWLLPFVDASTTLSPIKTGPLVATTISAALGTTPDKIPHPEPPLSPIETTADSSARQ